MGTPHTLEEIGSRLPPTRERTGSRQGCCKALRIGKCVGAARGEGSGTAMARPHEPELLEDEIVRTEAELEAVSNKLQRLTQLRQLSKDTEVAKEALDKLASEMAAQNLCHEQIAASLEVLKTQLAEAA
jgi:hypothetical protein